MSKIKAYSILDIRPDMIVNNIKVLGNYQVTINLEEFGHFEVTTTPDLTATHKGIISSLIETVGIAQITP